jgi:uncharacterized protein YecE (DUF72 family)
VWRGRYSEARFERGCLAEYAEVFPTVSVDATYYAFPTVRFLEGLAGQVPDHFRFAFKVTDEVTHARFPGLSRFGGRAGQPNPNFLNADLLADAFLARCAAISPRVGLLMLEFSRFSRGEFARGAEFAAALDAFLGRLPRDWAYGVEIRNREWLQPGYFEVLARHGVTHIYNAWADMPPVPDQLNLPDSETNPGLLAARFLLREGRAYEAAVQQFSPYAELRDPNPEGRAAGARLIRRGLARPGRTRVFVFVNNRFEGHAPGTVRAMLDQAETAPA